MSMHHKTGFRLTFLTLSCVLCTHIVLLVFSPLINIHRIPLLLLLRVLYTITLAIVNTVLLTTIIYLNHKSPFCYPYIQMLINSQSPISTDGRLVDNNHRRRLRGQPRHAPFTIIELGAKVSFPQKKSR